MFDAQTYAARRERLRKQVSSGLILILGNDESPMNYPANTYRFRQDSTFLYFFGLDQPGLASVIDAETGVETLYGNDISIEDIIWMGFQPTLKERGLRVGVSNAAPLAKLEETVREARAKRRPVHVLPPYRSEQEAWLAALLGVRPVEVKAKSSEPLIRAVVAQRLIKSQAEVREIEAAVRVSHEMYITAMKAAKPGVREQDIVGKIEGLAIGRGRGTAFPTILTINGQTLHNHDHSHTLKKGNMLVVDAGAESLRHYASDITRTLPVGGRFTARQRPVYDIVLEAQETAISAMKPGVLYRDIHLQVSRLMASRLKDLGLMKGDPAEAVAAGAHALFFPHGLGHQLGLDVHDMESLGENHIGYNDRIKRSDQFGLAYLRYARELETGQVLTVEPGLYFIPALIDQWKSEKKFASFVDYGRVETYRRFGGIRIEDNVLITAQGHRVLGPPIPKKVKDLEKTMAGRS